MALHNGAVLVLMCLYWISQANDLVTVWCTGQFIHNQFHDVVKPANADFCVVCSHYASIHMGKK